MLEKFKQYFFPFLVALSAFSLAGAAAFFSVTGLSKLFGGAQEAVIIMASSLEFSKLVTASFLHRHWKTIEWKLKIYLTTGTVVIMFITSAGIYGFLSRAYSETSNKLEIHEGELGVLESKKQSFEKTIFDNTKIIETKTKRVDQLNNLRGNQESRLDNSTSNRNQRNARKDIEASDRQIQLLNTEIDVLNAKNIVLSDSVNVYNIKVIELKSGSDISGEVGPLKYISKLTGAPMANVVNYLILLLVFVFDPMAVCLVIATNISLEKAGLKSLGDVIPRKKEENQDKINEEVDDDLNSVDFEEELEPIKLIDDLGVDEEVEKDYKIEYKSNKEGEFIQQEPSGTLSSNEAVQILNDIKLQGIQTNEKYQLFLDSLYMNGALKVGDTLPHYSKFVEDLKSRGIQHEDKEVLDFLTICNLLKVTDMNGSDRRVAKDYEIAKGIFKVLSPN